MNKPSRPALRNLCAAGVLGGAALAAAPGAQAETIELLSSGSMLSGKQTWSSELDIQSAGILSMRVNDLGVAGTIIEEVDSLSFSVANSTNVLAARLGEGLLSLDIASPGLYFLNIAAMADPDSRFQLGLVSWNATFTPAAPVPLPAAAWLLIAGTAWTVGLQRK